MKKIFPLLLALAMVFTWSLSAHALFINNLDGTITDGDTNLMWLQDANAGAGSAFDDGFNATDGRMTWQNANDWAASLTVGGFTDWRLPTTTVPDTTCIGSSSNGFGSGCTGSEMGNLFNVEDISTAALGPFSNIQADNYWSSTEFAPGSIFASNFSFGTGFQSSNNMGNGYFASAVRPGDVAAVPEPSMLILLGSGLVRLIGFGWKNGRLRR